MKEKIQNGHLNMNSKNKFMLGKLSVNGQSRIIDHSLFTIDNWLKQFQKIIFSTVFVL